MEFIYLFFAVCFCSLQTINNKHFGYKENAGIFTFTSLVCFSAVPIFLIQTKSYAITLTVFAFALMFAALCFIADLFAVLAFKHGPVARTSLISSFSLLIPTIYGIIFLKEDIKLLMLIGTLCLLISLFLVNYTKSNEKITSLWILFVVLSFFGNGLCSVVQRLEQLCCQGELYSDIFMVVAFMLAGLFSLIAAFACEKKEKIFLTVRTSWHLAITKGLMMGLVNMLIIKLNTLLPASILFPVVAAGSLLINWLLSFIVYRERFTYKQTIGYIFGLVAVILLNL